MTSNRRYRIGIDAFGIALLAFVMLPNIIWFAIPVPNDVLRGDSAVPLLDGVVTVFQAAMAVLFCTIVNIHLKNPIKKRSLRAYQRRWSCIPRDGYFIIWAQ